MTTQAPPHHLDRSTTLPAHEQPTAAIEPGTDETIVDSLPLLDHRSRSRAISPRLAARGRYLALQDGEETRLIRLETNITHLGRGLTSDLRFEHQHVSRTHALVVRHGRVVRVLDNRSTAGTFVNGRRVVATNIQNGDVIRVGPVVLQYVEIR
ncbi:MAG TPA: FHA domain-containing protein [Solirubrobacteraceae bacterium]|nr:FHA domain-containing protein [Solirubrobacteraceae bacterium]